MRTRCKPQKIKTKALYVICRGKGCISTICFSGVAHDEVQKICVDCGYKMSVILPRE